MKYLIPLKLTLAADAFLKHIGVDADDLYYTFKLLDIEEALTFCKHELNYPLLLNDAADYFTHQEGLMFIPFVKQRLEKLLAIEESGDVFEFFSWGSGEQANNEDLAVFTGIYVLSLLKEAAFTVNFKAFGFATFEEFLYGASAHMRNLIERGHGESDYHWITPNSNGRIYLNRFAKQIHGDFRFNQYDLSPRKEISPFGDVIGFSLAANNCLAAYHSVECVFFSAILRYSIQCGVIPDVLKTYDAFIEGLRQEGCYLGNFADAGMKSFYMEGSNVDFEIPKKDVNVGLNFHSMPVEHGGSQKAFIDGNDLVFLPCGVRFNSDDINHLIVGLHKACQEGYYRTSVANLIEFFSEVKENYLRLVDHAEKTKRVRALLGPMVANNGTIRGSLVGDSASSARVSAMGMLKGKEKVPKAEAGANAVFDALCDFAEIDKTQCLAVQDVSLASWLVQS